MNRVFIWECRLQHDVLGKRTGEYEFISELLFFLLPYCSNVYYFNKLWLESASGHNACASTAAQEQPRGATATAGRASPNHVNRGLASPLPQAVVVPLYRVRNLVRHRCDVDRPWTAIWGPQLLPARRRRRRKGISPHIIENRHRFVTS